MRAKAAVVSSTEEMRRARSDSAASVIFTPPPCGTRKPVRVPARGLQSTDGTSVPTRPGPLRFDPHPARADPVPGLLRFWPSPSLNLRYRIFLSGVGGMYLTIARGPLRARQYH